MALVFSPITFRAHMRSATADQCTPEQKLLSENVAYLVEDCLNHLFSRVLYEEVIA